MSCISEGGKRNRSQFLGKIARKFAIIVRTRLAAAVLK
jgi:hypothetical protein